MLLNAVKEYDGLCRKYHEKIPLWFARYDRVKQLLLDRCPDYKFVPELEAHKYFDYSGLGTEEQFRIWEKAGKTWDPRHSYVEMIRRTRRIPCKQGRRTYIRYSLVWANCCFYMACTPAPFEGTREGWSGRVGWRRRE